MIATVDTVDACIPRAADRSDRRTLSLKLTVTARQMHRSFDQNVANIGITRSQWTLIAVIARHPGATQREIAEALEMSEASVGRLVDRLCVDGLLVRRAKEDDRRAHSVHLTAAADALLDKISRIATQHETVVFAGFAPEDIERMTTYLDLIAANLAATR